MAITTRDGATAALATAQHVEWNKQTLRTTVLGIWHSLFDLAGAPGAGVLAGTSTTAGVVPDDTVAGFYPLNAFGVGATGYVWKAEFGSNAAGRVMVFDCLWKGGAYPFNAAVTLSAQPSYSARIPGADYKGTQIWLECVTVFTGNQSIAITYTNQDGVTGRTTGTVATAVNPATVGRMFRMPLQSGDTGVQKIESVTSTVSTVGTFNVLVLRPLVDGRVHVVNDSMSKGPDLTGLPIMFAASALFVAIATDGVSSGIPEVRLTVVNG